MFPWGSHTPVAFDVIHKWALRPVATVESWFPTAASLRCLLTFGFLEQLWRPHANREAASLMGHREGSFYGKAARTLLQKETHLPSLRRALASVGYEVLAAFTLHTLSSPPPGRAPCCSTFHYFSPLAKRSAQVTQTFPLLKVFTLTGRWQTQPREESPKKTCLPHVEDVWGQQREASFLVSRKPNLVHYLLSAKPTKTRGWKDWENLPELSIRKYEPEGKPEEPKYLLLKPDIKHTDEDEKLLWATNPQHVPNVSASWEKTAIFIVAAIALFLKLFQVTDCLPP